MLSPKIHILFQKFDIPFFYLYYILGDRLRCEYLGQTNKVNGFLQENSMVAMEAFGVGLEFKYDFTIFYFKNNHYNIVAMIESYF